MKIKNYFLDSFVVASLLSVFFLTGCTHGIYSVGESEDKHNGTGADQWFNDVEELSEESLEQNAKSHWNISENYSASGSSSVEVTGYGAFVIEGDFDPDKWFRADDGKGYANNAKDARGAYTSPDFGAVTGGELSGYNESE